MFEQVHVFKCHSGKTDRMINDYFYLRNTFVLEYCGEVLDHKEFKTRVKEYARNKNIHYYFMSLKNNEVRNDVQ